MAFKEISIDTLKINPFHKISKEWMLITAGDEKKSNTMTASWGGVGIMWGKNVAYIVLRPQRYTKEFVDAGETFSLSVLDEEYRKTLSYLGTVSGRDEDKITKAGLTVEHADGTPYFGEANTVLVCRKLYAQNYDPACFIDKSCDEKCYPDKDYHTMYVVEIEKVLVD